MEKIKLRKLCVQKKKKERNGNKWMDSRNIWAINQWNLVIDQLGNGDRERDAKDDFWVLACTGRQMDGCAIDQDRKLWRGNGLYMHEWGKEKMDH